MKRKTMIALLSAFCICVGVTGCGNTGTSSDGTSEAESMSSAAESAAEESSSQESSEESDAAEAPAEETPEEAAQFTPKQEIIDAAANSGYIQICDDIFRDGGYLTVNDFLEQYGDNWECPGFDPAHERSNDLFFLDFNNKKSDTEMVIELVCVEPTESCATDGEMIVVKFRPWEGVEKVTWYPGGFVNSLGSDQLESVESLFQASGMTLGDSSEGTSDIPEDNPTQSVGKYYLFKNDKGNNEHISASVQMEDENLFGIKPVMGYTFSEIDTDYYYENILNGKEVPAGSPERVSSCSYSLLWCDGRKVYMY